MAGIGCSMRSAVARRGWNSRASSVLVLWTLLGLCLTPWAAWSQEAAYQGRLTDVNGFPQTGLVDLELRVYDLDSAGTVLYRELHLDVTLSDEGVFSVLLGGGTVTLSRKSGQVDYAALASSISSNFAGLMLPIVECLRIRL